MSESVETSSCESLTKHFEKVELSEEHEPKAAAPLSQSIFLDVRIKKGALKSDVQKMTSAIVGSLKAHAPLKNWRAFTPKDPELAARIDQILVGSPDVADGEVLDIDLISVPPENIHVYAAKTGGAMAQEISATTESREFSIGSHQWEIPCNEFDELWQNLIYDDNLKNELLSYVNALLRLSEHRVNSNIINVNRLVLLHGPPGTGKTSLCKALAQRLSVRLGRRYKRSIFVEVNSHSLFSKWFSESGKLIHRLFEQIEELAEEPNWLVFVLLDEVESLTMGRNSAFSGNDPSDSVRSVNAILTQLDKIRSYPNVLLLTTSNITGAIDSAFMDRTDICRFIGLPSADAIYTIFETTMNELCRVGIVKSVKESSAPDVVLSQYSARLMEISRKATGLSGRSIRKLPVLAYSKCTAEIVEMDAFLNELERAVDEKQLSSKHSKPFANDN